MKSASRGFSLIELMIAVAIIGILAAVVYPSYQGAMVKNRRASAQSYLADVAQKQQQYLMDARWYATTTTGLKATPPADVSKYYTITLTVSTTAPPAFTATAAPKAGTSQVSDGTLGITSNGTKFPAGKW